MNAWIPYIKLISVHTIVRITFSGHLPEICRWPYVGLPCNGIQESNQSWVQEWRQSGIILLDLKQFTSGVLSSNGVLCLQACRIWCGPHPHLVWTNLYRWEWPVSYGQDTVLLSFQGITSLLPAICSLVWLASHKLRVVSIIKWTILMGKLQLKKENNQQLSKKKNSTALKCGGWSNSLAQSTLPFYTVLLIEK